MTEKELDFKKEIVETKGSVVWYNYECLDEYDFSNFLTEGRSLSNLIEVIENEYDKEFYEKYGIYMFDYLEEQDRIVYFGNRYNVWFQPYTDWIVRHDNGKYEKTEKRR